MHGSNYGIGGSNAGTIEVEFIVHGELGPDRDLEAGGELVVGECPAVPNRPEPCELRVPLKGQNGEGKTR